MGNRQADILGDVQAEEEGAFLGATGADAALRQEKRGKKRGHSSNFMLLGSVRS
jgi:hypothetical protein